MEDKIWGTKNDKTTVALDANNDDNQISAVDNHIYFYSEVERCKMLELNKAIRELDIKLQKIALSLNMELPPIYIHINSYGGSIFAGLSTLDTLRNTKCKIITIIEGCAASAGTMISIVGEERWMQKHSYMLIHQLSSSSWGKYSELVDDMENNNKLMEMIKDLYEEYTQVPASQLEEILKHDLWWDAEKCLEYRLVDKILE